MRMSVGALFTVALALGTSGLVLAVEPGVDIAVPRVAISNVDGATVAFHPARLVVEQGDHVRWTRTGGSHTATSGSGCVASGLWTFSLNAFSTGPFTRQFNEAPGTLPYFCSPHCNLGMTGQVVVTPLIDATVVQDAAGATLLSWTGGLAPYRVLRSSGPAFIPAATVVLTAAGGTLGTSFQEQPGATPAVGSAFFYLVMNQF